jgi:hypothetical protein
MDSLVQSIQDCRGVAAGRLRASLDSLARLDDMGDRRCPRFPIVEEIDQAVRGRRFQVVDIRVEATAAAEDNPEWADIAAWVDTADQDKADQDKIDRDTVVADVAYATNFYRPIHQARRDLLPNQSPGQCR